MGSVLLLSGRIHALVGSSFSRREFPTHDEPVPSPVHIRHRGQLLTTGPAGTAARTNRTSMVRGDLWILRWNHTGDLDRARTGLDAVALDERVQRQNGNRRNLCAYRRERSFCWAGARGGLL